MPEQNTDLAAALKRIEDLEKLANALFKNIEKLQGASDKTFEAIGDRVDAIEKSVGKIAAGKVAATPTPPARRVLTDTSMTGRFRKTRFNPVPGVGKK